MVLPPLLRAAVLLALPLPLAPAAAEGEVLWMRTLELEAVTTAAAPEAELVAAVIAAEPRYRPCAEHLPDTEPEGAGPLPFQLTLWEAGTVRSVRGPEAVPAPLGRTSQCLEEALRELRFPPDPALSDARRVEVRFTPQWTRARLDLIQVDAATRERLEVPDPSVRGRIDLVSMGARIDSIAPRLGRCMRSARRRNPDLGQRLTVRLRLAQNREDPTSAEAWVEALTVVESELGDEDAEVCVIRELERLSWPRPQTPVAVVTWPFQFVE